MTFARYCIILLRYLNRSEAVMPALIPHIGISKSSSTIDEAKHSLCTGQPLQTILALRCLSEYINSVIPKQAADDLQESIQKHYNNTVAI